MPSWSLTSWSIVPFQPLFLKLIPNISVEYFRSPRILFKNCQVEVTFPFFIWHESDHCLPLHHCLITHSWTKECFGDLTQNSNKNNLKIGPYRCARCVLLTCLCLCRASVRIIQHFQCKGAFYDTDSCYSINWILILLSYPSPKSSFICKALTQS